MDYRAHTRHNVIVHRFGPVVTTQLDYACLSDSQYAAPCCKTFIGRGRFGLSELSDGGTAVNVKKLVGPLLIVFLLFWIISNPSGASGSVTGVLGNLKEAGTSMVTFMNGVLG